MKTILVLECSCLEELAYMAIKVRDAYREVGSDLAAQGAEAGSFRTTCGSKAAQFDAVATEAIAMIRCQMPGDFRGRC
jgi:hypothetical protein